VSIKNFSLPISLSNSEYCTCVFILFIAISYVNDQIMSLSVSDWQRKFHDFFTLRSESSTTLSLLGAKVPWHFRFSERKFLRAKVPAFYFYLLSTRVRTCHSICKQEEFVKSIGLVTIRFSEHRLVLYYRYSRIPRADLHNVIPYIPLFSH